MGTSRRTLALTQVLALAARSLLLGLILRPRYCPASDSWNCLSRLSLQTMSRVPGTRAKTFHPHQNPVR